MRRAYARQAAAAGIDFVVVIAAIGAIERWKHLNTPGEIAVHATKNIFATVTLLHGIAAVFLFWFVSTLAARMRQLEGGSGRLAAAVNGSGAIIAGVLAIGVGTMWASHQLHSPESAAYATSLLDGPTLFFPMAVLVGASGVIGMRRNDLPGYSRFLAWASLPLAVAFVVGAGLILFKDYAWINDSGNIAFALWIFLLSIIGIVRWGDLDETGLVVAPVATEDAPPLLPAAEVAPPPRRAKPAPKVKPAPKPKPKPSRRAARRRPEPEPEPEPEPVAEPAPEAEADDVEDVAPRKRRAPRKFAPRQTDLAREYEDRLNEADDEDETDAEDETEIDADADIDDLLFDVTPDEPDLDVDIGPAGGDEDEDEAEDESGSIYEIDTKDEEFGYGGPPRMKEPVDVTPARRRPSRKERAKAKPKPKPSKAATSDDAPAETRKPKPAPRKPRPRKVAPRGRRSGDTTEIIPQDER